MLRRPIVLIGSAMSALGLIGISLSAVGPGARHAPGHAAPLTMRVTNAKASVCTGGVAQWRVGTVVRTQGQPGAVLTIATWRADYANSRHAKQWHPVTVSQPTPDQFAPGSTLGPDGVLRAASQLQLALPCGARAARLVAIARLDCDVRARRVASLFLSEGIALSIPSVGGLGLLVVIGLVAARRLTAKEPA
jgi:hypothetical protein